MKRGNLLAKIAFCFTFIMGWAIVVVHMISNQWKPDATTLGFFAILAGLSLFPFTKSGKAGLLEWKKDDKDNIIQALAGLLQSHSSFLAYSVLPPEDREKAMATIRRQLSSIFKKLMDLVED